jgi:hypothetical protein
MNPALQSYLKQHPKVSSKLFSEKTVALLEQYPELVEHIIVSLRPAVLKAVLGNYKDKQDVIKHRIFILSVLQEKGILKVTDGKIEDQDWILFLTALDENKLELYARVFREIKEIKISDLDFFARVKAQHNIKALAELLTGPYPIADAKTFLPDTTQIKGFTLVNEYVCKRTRFFPKPWKQAIRAVWNDPSPQNSFALYKLYSERQVWLDNYRGTPIIYRFLSYFYSKPIFQTFNNELLTQLCTLLQSKNELTLDNYTKLTQMSEPLTQLCTSLQSESRLTYENYKIVAEMPETTQAFCCLLVAKGIVPVEQITQQYTDSIQDIPEPILSNIIAYNKTTLITPTALKLLIKLGKQNIDATAWMQYKPNWIILSKLSDRTLHTLSLLSLNASIFKKIEDLNNQDCIALLNTLTADQQTELLTEKSDENIHKLLKHMEKIGLLSPQNFDDIFGEQEHLADDTALYESLLKIEKTNSSRAQIQFERFMSKFGGSSTDRASATKPPSRILSTELIDDDSIAHHVRDELRKKHIAVTEESLGRFSPAVLHAFNTVLPVLEQDELLTQQHLMKRIALFSRAPNPKIRCRCLIILSQCGLLKDDNLAKFSTRLEATYEENRKLFEKIYAEIWGQSQPNGKWLEDTLSKGLKLEGCEPDHSEDYEKKFIQPFLIEHEENAVYLALDDTKHQIGQHRKASLIRRIIKLLDKSKVNIESILETLLDTDITQVIKIYIWLFILDKAGVLNFENSTNIIQQIKSLPGKIDFLKDIRTHLTKHTEAFENHKNFIQATIQQLIQPDSESTTFFDYMKLILENKTPAELNAFVVTNNLTQVVTQLAEKAKEVVAQVPNIQKPLSPIIDQVTALTGKAYQFFSSQEDKPESSLSNHVQIAMQHRNFKDSYYERFPNNLVDALKLLDEYDLLSTATTNWLMEQKDKKRIFDALTYLKRAQLLAKDKPWQENALKLSQKTTKEFEKMLVDRSKSYLKFYGDFTKKQDNYKDSYYATSPKALNEVLKLLYEHDLISKVTIKWLLEQKDQKRIFDALTYLKRAQLLAKDKPWQANALKLSQKTTEEFEEFKEFVNRQLIKSYLNIASHHSQFDESYYTEHPQHLKKMLKVLLSYNLLSEDNVNWLMDQRDQKRVYDAIILLKQVEYPLTADRWKAILTSLFQSTPEKFEALSQLQSKQLLNRYSEIAKKRTHSSDLFYKNFPLSLEEDLNLLFSHDLLSEDNVNWLMDQTNQERVHQAIHYLDQSGKFYQKLWKKFALELSTESPEQFSTRLEQLKGRGKKL